MAGFCAKCGTQLADNIGFCANCGTRTASAPQTQNVQQVQQTFEFQQQQTFQFDQPQTDYFQPVPPPTKQPAPEKTGMSNIAAFFLALVVLALGTTGFFAFKEDGFLRRDSEETSKSRSSKEKSSKAEKQSLIDNIEQQLGCSIADTLHISGNPADMERYCSYLQVNNVSCEFNIYESDKSELFFKKSDKDRALMLVNQLRQNNHEMDTQQNTQQKSAPQKKHKSRI